MAQETQFSILFSKYTNGSATPKEIHAFFQMLDDPDHQAELKGLVELAMETFDESVYLESEEKQTILNSIFSLSSVKIDSRKFKTQRIWPRFVAAASILLVLSITAYFSLNRRNAVEAVKNSHEQNIESAIAKATLSLSNGQKITLTGGLAGNLSKQGSTIIQVKQGKFISYESNENKNATQQIKQFNTLSTARGQQSPYTLILSDGTKVWLNAASSITFPVVFQGKQRTVNITGEVYFEVAHNPAKPFIVSSKRQVVEVLGTHFNIMAYPDEAVDQTTLFQGSVKITSNNRMKLLIPGQQAQVDDHKISVSAAVDLEDVMSWKNGYFKFNEPLKSILDKISRWYNVEVIYDLRTNQGQSFSGEVSRSTNLNTLLKVIESTGNVHFKLEGRRLNVMP